MPPVVFPIGAYRKELAADHLDRLLGKSILDWLIHKCGVTEDSHASGSNQPERSGDGGSIKTQRNRNNQQTGVQLRGGESCKAQVKITALELADSIQTTSNQQDDKKQRQIGQQAVYAEHDKDGGIVAREIGQVVVHTALNLAKIGRLREALDIEELRDWSEVGETRGKRLRADAIEAITESRGNRVNGELNWTHCELVVGGFVDGYKL